MNDTKIKLACYCACGCGGCDTAVLDTDHQILELSKVAEIVFWPIAVDVKESAVEALPDGYVDLCLFNGSIRNKENETMAAMLRKKSKVLIAFGACACTGGISGLLNTTDTRSVKETVYAGVPSVDGSRAGAPLLCTAMDGADLTLPELFDTVRSLDEVVDVDFYVPGCPPAPARIREVIGAYLAGDLPEKGAVLGAADKAVCHTCRRVTTGITADEYKRLHLAIPDENTCFLDQGIVCLGPVTRSGCGEACVHGNMPCMGCYGLTPKTSDAGGAMIGRLASLIERDVQASGDPAVHGIADPVGSLYLFTLAKSLLGKVKRG